MAGIIPNVNLESMVPVKTLLLFRCTTLEFANKFLETGNLRFGLPKEWIDSFKKDGAGRGDLLEGAFASLEKIDERQIDYFKSLRPNVKISENPIEGFYYFQSMDVLNMRTLCLFGLNDNMFPSKELAPDRRFYPSGTITKRYFEDFAPKITEENYDSLESHEKPVVIMINNPHEFLNRLRKFLYSLGLNDNEFIIRRVGYLDKHLQFLVGASIPEELFIKDSSFSYQSEIRIVISSINADVIKKIDATDGIFNIGPMNDIADIQEYYFKDFSMQKLDNKIIFTLPKPKTEEASKERLMAIIRQILTNRMMKEMVIGDYTKEEQLDLAAKMLKEKFHICFDRNTLTFYADENYKPSDPNDLGRQWILTGISDILSGDGCALLERGECIDAAQNFSDAIDIDSSRSDFWYNRGIAYSRLNQDEKALADYNQAIVLEPDNAKYLFGRAKIYNKLGLPEKAQLDYIDGVKAYGNIEDHSYDNDNDKKLLYDFALAAQSTANYDTALSAICKCIELQYNIPESYNIQGNIYLSLNQIDLAIKSYNIFMKENGDPFTANQNLGVAYMSRGCNNKSKEDFSLSWKYFKEARIICSTPFLESNIRRWYINNYLILGLNEETFRSAIIDEYQYNPLDKGIRKLYEKFIVTLNDSFS